jgi:hypothetical protein
MLRDIITHKWILGAVGFLIVLSVACVLWYQQDMAPYKQEAAQTAETAQQWKIEKSNTGSGAETASPQAPADSTTLTAEKQRTNTTSVTKDAEPTQAQAETETAEMAEVRVSPYGFGPYPEVPEDYPSKVSWNRHYPDATDEVRRELELISRVLVKLWTDGDKNFRGGSTYKGKIYPHYNDTVYVQHKYKMIDGKMVKYATRAKSGPRVSYNVSDLDNPPPHLRILDLDSSGIDPYQFLDLP